MAPIEPDLSNSNIWALSVFCGYVALALGLVAFLSYEVLWREFTSLPPSQATRLRVSNRNKHVLLFAILALCSLVVTSYHIFSYLVLSYKVWANNVGEDEPQALFGERGIFGGGTERLALGRWLHDTRLIQDAWEIMIEKSGRFWWTQQAFLGYGSWSIFLGMEGKRRNITSLWAFMFLGQLVALSVAMNLFFIAILLKPVTLAPHHGHHSSLSTSSTVAAKANDQRRSLLALGREILPYLPQSFRRTQPAAWTPHPIVLIAPLCVIYTCTFLLPLSIATPTFLPLLMVSHLALYRPLYFDRFLPIAYGSVNRPGRSYMFVFRFMAYASFLLHAKQTVVALLDNDPGAHEHRHSTYLAYLHLLHAQERTAGDRSKTALGNVLAAIGDHPAVSHMGWDVILCGISLTAWATVRGLDISKIARAAGLVTSKADSIVHGTAKTKTKTTEAAVSADEVDTKSRRPRRRPKSSGRTKDAVEDGEADSLYSRSNIDGPVFAGEEEMRQDFEAGAVGCALLFAGGLGVATASVWGAEVER